MMKLSALLPIPQLLFWLGCFAFQVVVNGSSSTTTSSSGTTVTTTTRSLVQEGCDQTGCLHWEFDAEKQSQLEAWQTEMTSTAYSWEWVVVRVNGVGGLEDADLLNAADAYVKATAVLTTEEGLPRVEFHGDEKLNEFVFPARDNTNQPKWYQLGMVLFLRGTSTQLQIQMLDDETVAQSDQVLLDQTVDLEATMDTWVDMVLTQDDYSLNVSMWRSATPIQSESSQTGMGLTEESLSLRNNNLALLNHKTNGDHKKAVLYLPGKSDSFAHPHVLKMYEQRGYDFYTLDARYCGRTVQYMNDTQYGHWINDFDVYTEELDQTIQFIKSKQEYETLVLHCHSTGCLIGLNYLLQLSQVEGGSDPFDAIVMNGPFLDWGFVGGWFYEFALENTDFMSVFTGDNSLEASGLSLWQTRNYILYQYSPQTSRTIIQSHVNNEWAKAVTTAQDKITARPIDDPITTQPIFTIVSRGDDTLSPFETQERLRHISNNTVAVWLDHNAHDVTLSHTTPLNNDALGEINSWLDWYENEYAVNQSAVYDDSTKIVESSSSSAATAVVKGWTVTTAWSAALVVVVATSSLLVDVGSGLLVFG